MLAPLWCPHTCVLHDGWSWLALVDMALDLRKPQDLTKLRGWKVLHLREWQECFFFSHPELTQTNVTNPFPSQSLKLPLSNKLVKEVKSNSNKNYKKMLNKTQCYWCVFRVSLWVLVLPLTVLEGCVLISFWVKAFSDSPAPTELWCPVCV